MMATSHEQGSGAFGLDLSDGSGGKEMIDAPMLKQVSSVAIRTRLSWLMLLRHIASSAWLNWLVSIFLTEDVCDYEPGGRLQYRPLMGICTSLLIVFADVLELHRCTAIAWMDRTNTQM